MPPPARVMLDLQDGTPSSATEERLKVFSYNTLCSKLATNTLYGYTPSGALNWDYRKEQILQEIQASEADFICLQEVDSDSFKEFFSMKLAYNGYKGVFWPKSRARTMSEKDAKVVDGCATFYKANKYILLDKQLIDFANIAINRPDMKNQHDIFNRVMPRDNIAIVTFFESRTTGSRVVVVNAHLCWDPVYADVKVIQTAILMDHVTKLADKYARWPACKDKKTYTLSDNDGNDIPEEPVPEPAPSMEYTSSTQLPLLVCGDFNSTPDSAVYELLSHGTLQGDHSEMGTFQYGNFTRDGMQHPFSLRSAYASLNGTPDELTFTNYTPGFIGLLDYIWYATNALEVTALLGPPDAEYLKRMPGFPHYHFPSDHLSILAEFVVKGRKEKKIHPEPDFGSQRERRN
jgi:CCR4-NOT transcription complex subunit 6